MTNEDKRPLIRMLEPLLNIPLADLREAGVPDDIITRAQRSNDKATALAHRMDEAYELNKPLLLSTEELFQVYVLIGAAFGMVLAEKREIVRLEDLLEEARGSSGVMCWLLARLTEGREVRVPEKDASELDEDSQWAVEAEAQRDDTNGDYIYKFRRIMKHEAPPSVQ